MSVKSAKYNRIWNSLSMFIGTMDATYPVFYCSCHSECIDIRTGISGHYVMIVKDKNHLSCLRKITKVEELQYMVDNRLKVPSTNLTQIK